MMLRINLVLMLALLASAMVVVRTQYESRRLFVEVEKANKEARVLAAEAERLSAERRAQATPARVEKLARDKLQMLSVNPGVTQYVLPASSAASGVVR
jgi:cell division protein FtsL